MAKSSREVGRLAYGTKPPPESVRCTGVEARRTANGMSAYQVRRLRDALGERWGKPLDGSFNADFAMVVFRSRDPSTPSAWRYLLQHRSPEIWGGRRDKGAGMLGLPGGKADADDGWPDVTAWREVREECLPPGAGEALTLEKFQTAVVSAVAQPVQGLIDRSRPAVPSDPKNTRGHGVLYVVDADRLVKEGGLPGLDAWAAGPGTPGEVTESEFPGGHLWISEAELDEALVLWLGRGGRTGHVFGAEGPTRHGEGPLTPNDSRWEAVKVGPATGGGRAPRRRRKMAAARAARSERFGEIRPETKGPPPRFRGVPLWPLVGITLALYRPALGYSRPVVLYFGAPAEAAETIERDGLRAGGADCTSMMGEGIYLAGLAKAAKFSRLAGDGSGGAKGARDGVVYMCEVDFSGVAVDITAPLRPSPEVETAPAYVDYCGCWRRLGYGAAFSAGGTSARLPEFVVADPKKVRLLRRIFLPADRESRGEVSGAREAPPETPPETTPETSSSRTGGGEPSLAVEYARMVAAANVLKRFAGALAGKGAKRDRRANVYEIRGALERWAMARANSGRGSVGPKRGLDVELMRKWGLSPREASALSGEAEDLMSGVGRPPDLEVRAECEGGEVAAVAPDRRFVLGRGERTAALVAAGGCGATAAMLARYKANFSQGQQWAVPRAQVDILYRAGVRNEAFASPINSTMFGREGGVFFSVFPDVDSPFGSRGSFFDSSPLDYPGGWLLNPPFVEEIMAAAAQKLSQLLEELEGRPPGAPIVFVMPAWLDSRAYETMERLLEAGGAKHLLKRGTYAYENGAERVVARFDSLCYSFGWESPDWSGFEPPRPGPPHPLHHK